MLKKKAALPLVTLLIFILFIIYLASSRLFNFFYGHFTGFNVSIGFASVSSIYDHFFLYLFIFFRWLSFDHFYDFPLLLLHCHFLGPVSFDSFNLDSLSRLCPDFSIFTNFLTELTANLPIINLQIDNLQVRIISSSLTVPSMVTK